MFHFRLLDSILTGFLTLTLKLKFNSNIVGQLEEIHHEVSWCFFAGEVCLLAPYWSHSKSKCIVVGKNCTVFHATTSAIIVGTGLFKNIK